MSRIRDTKAQTRLTGEMLAKLLARELEGESSREYVAVRLEANRQKRKDEGRL